MASGLVTNISKCSVSPIQCHQQDIETVQSSIECKVQEFPCKYLGLPLSIQKLPESEFYVIIDKIAVDSGCGHLVGWCPWQQLQCDDDCHPVCETIMSSSHTPTTTMTSGLPSMAKPEKMPWARGTRLTTDSTTTSPSPCTLLLGCNLQDGYQDLLYHPWYEDQLDDSSLQHKWTDWFSVHVVRLLDSNHWSLFDNHPLQQSDVLGLPLLESQI